MATLGPVCRAALRDPRAAQGLGLLAKGLPPTLLLFGEILCSAALPRGGLLCEPVVENWGQLVSRGGRGLRRPALTPHAAPKGPAITGAGAETWRRQAPGAPGALWGPSAARGASFPTPELLVRPAAPAGGTLLVGRPLMPMEAPCCEDARERVGVSPWPLGEVDAGEAGERGTEGKGRCLAWRVPRRRRGGRPGRDGRSAEGCTRAADALACLSADGAGLRGKVRERERVGARAARGRPVTPLERFGHGLGTGLEAVVPRRRSGLGRAPATSARRRRLPVPPVLALSPGGRYRCI